MKALVLCDDYWHPAGNARGGLSAMPGLEPDWIEHASQWPRHRLQAYPVVILSKWNHVSEQDLRPWADAAVQQAFVDYVHGGGGLLVIHSGAAGYRDQPVLRALMGGAFTHHPDPCPVSVEPCGSHPLQAGLAPFAVEDEHYFVALDDANSEVFLRTVSAHGSQPGGWTRQEGKGRVCVLTPGHSLAVWLHPQYQGLIARALQWCTNP